MRQMKKVVEDKKWDADTNADANDVVVAFDLMIIQSQMLLSSK